MVRVICNRCEEITEVPDDYMDKYKVTYCICPRLAKEFNIRTDYMELDHLLNNPSPCTILSE